MSEQPTCSFEAVKKRGLADTEPKFDCVEGRSYESPPYTDILRFMVLKKTISKMPKVIAV